MEDILGKFDALEYDLDEGIDTEDEFLADLFDSKFDAFRYGFNEALKAVMEVINKGGD